MHTESLIMIVLGIILFLVALINASIIFKKEARDYLNRKIELAKHHLIIIFSSTLLTYLVGMILLLSRSKIFHILMIISSVILGLSLIYIEISTFWTLIKDEHLPSLSRDFLNTLLYVSILWIIFERINLSWLEIAIVSTLFTIVIFIYAGSFLKYYKVFDVIISPIDLSPITISTRLFSLFMGVHLSATELYPAVFRGFIVLGYLILLYSFYSVHTDIKKLST